MPLEQFLPSQVFILALMFARIGAMVMLMPGIGETYVNVRVRLFIALTLTLVLAPVIEPYMPVAAPLDSVALTLQEIVDV
ncbi:MAG: flagellar biosynthetic protein FliR, partial [Thalassobaculaceae bacterium]